MEEKEDLATSSQKEEEVIIGHKKSSDEVKVNFKFKKIYLIIAGALVLLVVLGLLAWKFDFYNKVYNSYYKADADVTAVDKDSNTPLLAEINLAGKSKHTVSQKATLDSAGKVHLSGLVKGSYTATISALGYYDLSQDITLTKGTNTFSFKLTKVPPKQARVSGEIHNYINEKVIADAKVTIGDKTAQSGTDGKFTFEGLNLEKYVIKIEKTGFIAYSAETTVADIEHTLDQINLVPEGKVVFSSNRDKGKSGIYTANYDGSDQKALIARIGDYEDFSPLVSPDNTKVAFISGREGKKDESNNNINNLFIVNIDGKSLVKAEDVNCNYGFQWVKDSTKILWSTYSKNISSYYLYDIASKTNQQIGTPDKNISNTTVNNTEDKIIYSVYNSATYRSDYYWVTIANPSAPAQILTDQSNISILKFDGNVVTYSQYNQDDKTTKFHTIDVTTGVIKDIQYEHPKGDSFVKSPDGKLKAYVSNRDGKSNVFISDLTGSNEVKLTSVDAAQWPLSWSLDSKMLLFNVNKTGESALYIVGIDGGDAKKVVDVYSAGYGYGMY